MRGKASRFLGPTFWFYKSKTCSNFGSRRRLARTVFGPIVWLFLSRFLCRTGTCCRGPTSSHTLKAMSLCDTASRRPLVLTRQGSWLSSRWIFKFWGEKSRLRGDNFVPRCWREAAFRGRPSLGSLEDQADRARILSEPLQLRLRDRNVWAPPPRTSLGGRRRSRPAAGPSYPVDAQYPSYGQQVTATLSWRSGASSAGAVTVP
jgi:hypothetical protein